MGWVYNLQTPDPDSHIPRVIAISMVFAGVACLTVALRFHVRIWVKKAVWVDDFAALFSALMAVGYAGLIVARMSIVFPLFVRFSTQGNGDEYRTNSLGKRRDTLGTRTP